MGDKTILPLPLPSPSPHSSNLSPPFYSLLSPPHPLTLSLLSSLSPRANMITLTRSGHGYQEEGGVAQLGSPYHAGLDEGAMMSRGQMAQHGEIVGAPGIQHKPPTVSHCDGLHIWSFKGGTFSTFLSDCVLATELPTVTATFVFFYSNFCVLL